MRLQARFILAKIKGEILIENKRKVAIVEQLVKKGFDPDPVKKWKELQRRKELEMTGEVEVDEEELEQDEEEVGIYLNIPCFLKDLLHYKIICRKAYCNLLTVECWE